MTEKPSTFPLFDRFPGLIELPRVELCTLPSPVQRVEHSLIRGEMWIKRDDLDAPACGGNKARALEFLLGGLMPGDTVITVGGAGSTHVLSTAAYTAQLGATLKSRRWKHDMNPVADAVSSRIAKLVGESPVSRSAALSILSAKYEQLKTGARYIPVGGSTPIGILGHVNAALELARQIEEGLLPSPEKIVLPVGSGGTAAGLLLGFAIAGLPIELVGARVGPGLFVNRRNVLALARRTSKLIERVAGERPALLDKARLRIVHGVYGGAYGRPLSESGDAGVILRDSTGIELDGTYSAKAWVAALAESRVTQGPVLFWLTFDARCLTN